MNRIEQHKAYWLGRLSDAPPPPKLPWDKERPPVSSFVRESVSTQIGADTWLGIKHLAVWAGTTPQVVLLAVLKTLMYRYTGQTDLIIGTLLGSSAGASRRELVALRTKLAGDSTAQDLVLRVAASVREASEHLELPFGAVLELLGRQGGAQVEGLFNIALIYLEPAHSPAILARPVEASCAERLIACPLVVRASEVDNGLALSCEYDAEVLERATVERLAGHFGSLLAGMAAEPRTTLDKVCLLSAAEMGQLLVEWNATETVVPGSACIHHLIEAQAKDTPDAVAAVCRNRQLTFAELNARANQVASHLSKLGVGPEALVGICVDRSLEMLVGLLGV